jgi:hypothetical protein
VRPDGTASLVRLGTRSATAWTPVPLRAASAEGPGIDRLEVRVTPTAVVCLVNGATAGSAALAPGDLDGAAGVHVGAGGDVVVAAFRVQGTGVVVRPEAVR